MLSIDIYRRLFTRLYLQLFIYTLNEGAQRGDKQFRFVNCAPAIGGSLTEFLSYRPLPGVELLREINLSAVVPLFIFWGDYFSRYLMFFDFSSKSSNCQFSLFFVEIDVK